MPWACGCAGEPDLGIPVHDKAVVERFRKIREHARRSEGNEREVAKTLLKKLTDTHLLLAKQVKDLDHAEAVAKANEHVARAAASRAAAMHNGVDGSPLTATDQVAYWSGFIEETIAYIADHPNEPTPSAVAFVETLDLGQEGRLFTSIKKMGALTLARWADSKIAEQVEELREMQRDLERGKVPAAVQRAVDRARGKRPKKRKPKPTSRKRKKSMAEALLKTIEDECDCELAESEDTKAKEELWEFGLVIPKKLWSRILENPEVLVQYMNDTIVESGEEPEEEPDSGLGLDEDDPFPDPEDDEETHDPDGGDEDEDSDR